MFGGTKGTLGTMVMPDDLGIREPVWLVPEKQASKITVTDLAGIFPRFLYSCQCSNLAEFSAVREV